MDSLDFFRNCVWNIDRDEADARLAAVLAWVGTYAVPDRVFVSSKLAQWAHDNGYTEEHDITSIVDLLKQSQQWVPRHTQLATALQSAVSEFGRVA